jgi:hypothetical protein
MAEVIYDCHLASHLPCILVEHPFDGAPVTINQPTDGHLSVAAELTCDGSR